MNKIICLVFVVFLFTSCSKINVIDETIVEENNDTIPFEIILRDAISDTIVIYPDAKKHPLN